RFILYLNLSWISCDCLLIFSRKPPDLFVILILCHLCGKENRMILFLKFLFLVSSENDERFRDLWSSREDAQSKGILLPPSRSLPPSPHLALFSLRSPSVPGLVPFLVGVHRNTIPMGVFSSSIIELS